MFHTKITIYNEDKLIKNEMITPRWVEVFLILSGLSIITFPFKEMNMIAMWDSQIVLLESLKDFFFGIRDIMKNLIPWFGHVKNCPRTNMVSWYL